MAEKTVFLKALTPEAKAALGGIYYRIVKFPFRLGRESHTTMINGFIKLCRQANSVPNNDLCLVETRALLDVSREHFLIDSQGGNHVLVDRRSTCGTIVEGELVGEKRKGGSSPHFSQAFYCGVGYGHVYGVALGRAPRHTIKYACGALHRAVSEAAYPCPSAPPRHEIL